MPEVPEGAPGGHGQKESMTLDDPADAVNSNLHINSQSLENQGNVPA